MESTHNKNFKVRNGALDSLNSVLIINQTKLLIFIQYYYSVLLFLFLYSFLAKYFLDTKILLM